MLTNKLAAKKARKLWQNFVQKNHHKDRDFQILILERVALYDDTHGEYAAYIPDAYLLDKEICSDFWTSRDNAETELILRMFEDMSDWVDKVLEHQEDYDLDQRVQAKYWDKTKKEREKLRLFLYQNWSSRADRCRVSDLKDMFDYKN